jgi:hypothetical protein
MRVLRVTAPARDHAACGSGAAESSFSKTAKRMIRTRFTWVIVGAVIAVLVVAGVDALRSSDKETSASATTAATTTAATTTVEQTLSCTRRQMEVSLLVMGQDPSRPRAPATIVAERLGASACRNDYRIFRMTIADRRGESMGLWNGRLISRSDSLRTSEDLVIPCDRPGGPYAVVVTTGPVGRSLSERFRSEIPSC